MKIEGSRVLVTGAGGFIGSHLVEQLVAAGADVTAFVKYNSMGSRGWLSGSEVENDVRFVHGDVSDPEFVSSAAQGQDAIFHLAALIGIPYSYDAPRQYVRTNVEGTLNVLTAARASGAVVAVTSTSEVYGSAQFVPITEAHPSVGQSPYSATKIAADAMADAYYRSFGTRVITVRPFNTYGPRQSARAIVPTVISQALAGNTIQLGNLTPTRDLNYVTDTAAGFIAAVECEAAIGEVFNFSTGKEISIGDLATLICEIVGTGSTVEIDPNRLRPEKSEVERLCGDSSHAREVLGWTPETDLRTGLAKTVEWVAENLAAFRPGQYMV